LRIGYILAGVTACILAGCSTGPTATTMNSEDERFDGLRQIIAEGGPIRMLLVHGMSSHAPDWGRAYLKPYADLLGAVLENGDEPRHLTPSNFPDNEFLRAHKNLTDDYSATLQRIPVRKDGRLVIEAYVLTWSPLTAPFKTERFSTDELLDRLVVNKAAKQFVNLTLSDVVLYLAGFDHHVLEDSVCSAVEIFDTRSLGGDQIKDSGAPVVLLSESLGSMMLFDAILGELPYDRESHVRRFDSKRAHAEMFRRTRLYIMAANQLPLLDAWPQVSYGELLAQEADQPSSGAPSVSSYRIRSLAALRRKGKGLAVQRPLDLLVFSDLNDVLSYRLDEQDVSSNPEIRIHNIQPVNSTHWIPYVYPKLFENPIAAHTGYKDNPDVWDIVVNGRRAN
jgi:hypothetical protein